MESLKERIARLHSAMEIGERKITSLPKACYPTDRLARDIADLEVLEHTLYDALHSLEIELIAAEEDIKRLPEKEQRIFRLRNIDGLKWQEISDKTNYSDRQCKRLNKKATKTLEN